MAVVVVVVMMAVDDDVWAGAPLFMCPSPERGPGSHPITLIA